MKIEQNIGSVDRTIRLLFATILIGHGVYYGWPVALLVGGALLVTAVIRVCPLYLPFRGSTKGLPRAKLQ